MSKLKIGLIQMKVENDKKDVKILSFNNKRRK